MAKNTNQISTVPIFTIAKPEKVKRTCAGKGKLPLTLIDKLAPTIKEIVDQAIEGGAKSVRGTLTFY